MCSDVRSQLSKASESSKVSFAFPPVASFKSWPKTASFKNRCLCFSDEHNTESNIDANDDCDTFNNPDKCEI